jgi:hypothetical protein
MDLAMKLNSRGQQKDALELKITPVTIEDNERYFFAELNRVTPDRQAVPRTLP